jgi:hypothetical protein
MRSPATVPRGVLRHSGRGEEALASSSPAARQQLAAAKPLCEDNQMGVVEAMWNLIGRTGAMTMLDCAR